MRWAMRRRCRHLTAVLSLAVAIAATAAGCAPAGDDHDEDAPETAGSAPASSERYTPEVEEGLGASVAILVDNSGSMRDRAAGDHRPKYEVAREALEAMLSATDSFVARRPDFPINVGLYEFSSDVRTLAPVRRYDRETLRSALAGMGRPDGGTAIGEAMDAARADLYRAGTFRKYILVVTDGENTDGRSPRRVAREIARRSEGAVRMYFVAFDVDAEKFGFVRDVRGEVLGARDASALRAGLNDIYRGKILAEALDAGETLPDSLADTTRSRSGEPSTERKP